MIRAALALAALAVVGPCASRAHAQPPAGRLSIIDRIPGPDGGWDYASFDPRHDRVLIAHGDKVLAIDARTLKMNPDFAAGDRLHEVLPIPGTDRLVATNSGDSSAKILDASTGRLIASVPTAADADGATFDPSTRYAMVVNGDPGIITEIDPKTSRAVGVIDVGDKLEFPAADGRGRLFVNVVSKDEVAEIDIAQKKVLARWPLTDCRHPTGLAYFGDRLITACGSGGANILDAASGKVIASFKIGGFPDAVIIDPRRRLAYIPSALSGTMAVIALSGPKSNSIIATIPTQIGARTGAVDPENGRVFLPTAQYVLPVPPGQRPQTKPGTFVVLVLSRK
ncbi:MAG: YncE family protein [Caulobacteraceae bacterium]